MRLSEYLEKNHLTPEQFAPRVGVHMTTIYRVLSGATIAKRTTIDAILKATNGHVTAADLFREFGPIKKKA